MGGAAWLLFGAAAILAAGDWIAVATRSKRLEYVCKPLTMAALIGVALTLQPAVSGQRSWWLAALALGLAGDVLLMLPSDRFLAGLAAFLVGHLAYIAGFWTAGVIPLLALAWFAVLLLPVGAVLSRLIRSARATGQGRLVLPVAVYGLVITAMVASALARPSLPAIGGASLFAISDGLIGIRRFVGDRRGMGVAVIVTYHLGQAALVLSLAR
ncbi:MAG TPA: lysoplasmalogenase [Candidatus Solibacter sp.]|nr:lysoplasmalogenase [Candidatus Solibacter sp.]